MTKYLHSAWFELNYKDEPLLTFANAICGRTYGCATVETFMSSKSKGCIDYPYQFSAMIQSSQGVHWISLIWAELQRWTSAKDSYNCNEESRDPK